ncbi:hypothetical protein HY382_03000 [Candidatus Curtissbacteria bacterium]|nr:hypothetical protein [Candidatus Curtissbacteria bacterium]
MGLKEDIEYRPPTQPLQPPPDRGVFNDRELKLRIHEQATNLYSECIVKTGLSNLISELKDDVIYPLHADVKRTETTNISDFYEKNAEIFAYSGTTKFVEISETLKFNYRRETHAPYINGWSNSDFNKELFDKFSVSLWFPLTADFKQIDLSRFQINLLFIKGVRTDDSVRFIPNYTNSAMQPENNILVARRSILLPNLEYFNDEHKNIIKEELISAYKNPLKGCNVERRYSSRQPRHEIRYLRFKNPELGSLQFGTVNKNLVNVSEIIKNGAEENSQIFGKINEDNYQVAETSQNELMQNEEAVDAMVDEWEQTYLSHGDARGDISYFDGHNYDEDGCETDSPF